MHFKTFIAALTTGVVFSAIPLASGMQVDKDFLLVMEYQPEGGQATSIFHRGLETNFCYTAPADRRDRITLAYLHQGHCYLYLTDYCAGNHEFEIKHTRFLPVDKVPPLAKPVGDKQFIRSWKCVYQNKSEGYDDYVKSLPAGTAPEKVDWSKRHRVRRGVAEAGL